MSCIAVLMTVHNRKSETLKSLKSLLLQRVNVDIYLVDDGCTDGTSEAVKTMFPSVHIINGNGKLFWNRGMILAWETAASKKDYDFYMWLNDDTCLNTSSIDELMNCSEKEHHKSIICGTTCSPDNNATYTYGGWKLKSTFVKPNGQIQYCDYFNGNIVLIPKYVYAIVGTNDPLFRHALGDFDYGLRARKAGIKSVVTPHVLGVCSDHESFAGWCNTKTPILKRLKLLYSPLGNDPIEFFRYDFRHNGILIATFHFFTIHLRAIIPHFWKDRKK